MAASDGKVGPFFVVIPDCATGFSCLPVGQCVSSCQGSPSDIRTVVTYNFTGIPTIQIVGADVTWEVAYLMLVASEFIPLPMDSLTCDHSHTGVPPI